MFSRVIWQYWETRGHKPAFIDGLHAIAKRNAGVEVILVTPETLGQYLPNIPPEIFNIGELAHKADMLRAMLVRRHGGMWLDSDAIVLQKLDWILDLLDTYEFVCFNDGGSIARGRPFVRVNCFASRAGGLIASEWVRQQHALLPRTRFRWAEIGSRLLHPICFDHQEKLKILPFEAIAPIPWNEAAEFINPEFDASSILRDCYMVMLNNNSLKSRAPLLRNMTVERIAHGDFLLSAVMRHAMKVAGLTIPTVEALNAD